MNSRTQAQPVAAGTLATFDIDGTLLDTVGLDSLLYQQAVRSVLGIEVDPDWGRYLHVSDSGILAQLMAENHIGPDSEILATQVQSEFSQLLSDTLRRDPGVVQEIAGARKFVEYLAARDDVVVAIATGGWCQTARLKLNAIGLDPDQLPIASASDAQARIEIMQIAEQRALAGRPVRRRLYFGDGPWDLTASEVLGYEFVAVGQQVSHAPALTSFEAIGDIVAALSL